MILYLQEKIFFASLLGYIIGKKIAEKKRKYRPMSIIQPQVKEWMRGSALCKFLRLDDTPNFESWIQETVKDKFQK